MKKMFKNSLLVAGAIALSLTACQNLTEKPDFVSPDTFFASDSDLKAAALIAH
jgi:hypothetical protein